MSGRVLANANLGVAMGKTANWAAKQFAVLAKKLAKTKPDKTHPILFEAWLYFVAAGDVARATRILDWTYGGRLPLPKEVATAHSTQAIDAFSAAAGLGDRTRGQPRFPPSSEAPPPLAERAQNADRMIRWQITSDRYQGNRLVGDAWRALPPTDAWRRINEWRDIQEAAAPTEGGDPRAGEAAALDLLAALLSSLAPDQRGAAHGDDLVLGLDVALRNGRDDLAAAWVKAHGARLFDSFHLAKLVCLSSVCAALIKGLLREVVGLPDAELAGALDALDAALRSGASLATPAKPPKVQKRRVDCAYSQIHLEHDAADERELGEVYFQDERESQQGMSLFRTHVGIGTPTETSHCDVEVILDPASAPVALDGVVQAVSFPIEVRGPMRLRSVAGTDEDDPLAIPAGPHDVLATFAPKRAPKMEAAASLRVFTLRLSFRPPGSLDAPKCLRLDEGSPAPAAIFSNG